MSNKIKIGDTVYFSPKMVQGILFGRLRLHEIKPYFGEVVSITQTDKDVYRYTIKSGRNYHALVYAAFLTEDEYIEYIAKYISKKPNNITLLIAAIKNLFS